MWADLTPVRYDLMVLALTRLMQSLDIQVASEKKVAGKAG